MDQIFTLLELAREKYEAVVDRENELNDKVARLDKMIAELKKEAVAPTRFVKLSTEIKNALTSLSTSTTGLGQALTALQAVRPRNRPASKPVRA